MSLTVVLCLQTMQAYGASFTLHNTSATHVLVVFGLEIRCNSDRGDEDEDVDPIAAAQVCILLTNCLCIVLSVYTHIYYI